jgi:ATP-dependent RNA helicase RhlE
LSFKTLNLSSKLLQTLEKLGYEEPTEIQMQAIPLLLKKRDLLASSQTGTGKTASFVLPLLENLQESAENKVGDERYKIQALILAPTRELVLQIHEKIEVYGENYAHGSVALYGGVKLGSQVSAIRQGANIAVGTTSRILDHVKNGTLDLSALEMIVLDEADKMLDMGFIDEVRSIVSLLPKERHAVMFSATFIPSIKSLAKSLLKNPMLVEIDKDNLSAKRINQKVCFVKEEEKMKALCELIHKNVWKQVLVFSNTKLKADQIVDNLKQLNIKSKAIHGDKSQAMRNQALKEFKEEKIDVLVATDVAARGLDILDLPYVINFELPLKVEDYVHRIGRTGRAGKEGLAISLLSQEEKIKLEQIETLINKQIDRLKIEGFEATKTISSDNKKKKSEKNVNMKKAKEIADKLMDKRGMGKKETKKSKNERAKRSINKRHF